MGPTTQTVAQLHGVTKSYGNVRALDNVDLTIRHGEILSLLGPNGAGKTTAISLLLGLLKPDTGKATLFDLDPASLIARRRIGAMLQTAGVPDTIAVGELIHLFRSYYPRPRTFADIVALAGVGDIVERRYGKLSGGQQRRAQFALAIAGNPELLFLDEPTTGLDINAREILWKTIRTLANDGCAIVLTTHYLEEAEALANCVCVLSQGHVVAAGDVQQIRARVGQRRVSCVSTLDSAAVSVWPNVRNVARVGDRIEIVTDAAENLVRRLLNEDAALSELEVHRAGLAEAFVEITKEAA